MDDRHWMREALREARAASELGEVPVGAVVVRDGEVIGRGHNRRETDGDPLAHAELLALHQAAAATAGWRLLDAALFVTLEPCAMCAAAISFARIRRLYFAASDEKTGAVENGPRFFSQAVCHHSPEVYGGIRAADAADLLKRFFGARR
jgi:tRNA(Arg) A34 adenosine deaminase TadA